MAVITTILLKKTEALCVTDKTLPSASGVLAYHSFTVYYTSAGSNSHEPSKILGNVSNGACAALFPGLQLESEQKRKCVGACCVFTKFQQD